MGTKGEQTREQILAIAEELILKNGYTATSIDQIITESGITKGGFFYHFDGKNDLARHLMLRYLEQDEIFFQSLKDRATALTEDPLQQLLLFLKLMAEDRSTTVLEWKLLNARPMKVTGPSLNGKSSDVAVEELVLSAENIQMTAP